MRITRDTFCGSRRRNIGSADAYKNFQANGSLSDESLESNKCTEGAILLSRKLSGKKTEV